METCDTSAILVVYEGRASVQKMYQFRPFIGYAAVIGPNCARSAGNLFEREGGPDIQYSMYHRK